ncbi:hypothetical protein RFI_20482 [Reticulomyxa filosa]|uniref:Uncharacterized protein n=1 Tax=Reticulomyxa filosa TaxID=46433 RepID=X6MSB1_RETFI|nr:hypothetical protein RFI_20482 [Reticulomyxa filosa]|eukprot:ETO16858.1 hypothetical protein RFI_20482 [Reticulomyxa filosa]
MLFMELNFHHLTVVDIYVLDLTYNTVLCADISPLQNNNKNDNNKSNSINVIDNNGYTICSGSLDKTICIWDIETTKQLLVFNGHKNHVKSVKYGSNEPGNSSSINTILSESDDASARLWNIRTGQQIQVFNGQIYYVNTFTFYNNGIFCLKFLQLKKKANKSNNYRDCTNLLLFLLLQNLFYDYFMIDILKTDMFSFYKRVTICQINLIKLIQFHSLLYYYYSTVEAFYSRLELFLSLCFIFCFKTNKIFHTQFYEIKYLQKSVFIQTVFVFVRFVLNTNMTSNVVRVYLVDTSGSMSGNKKEQACQQVESDKAIDHLYAFGSTIRAKLAR